MDELFVIITFVVDCSWYVFVCYMFRPPSQRYTVHGTHTASCSHSHCRTAVVGGSSCCFSMHVTSLHAAT